MKYPTQNTKIIDLKFMLKNGPLKARRRPLRGFWVPKIHPVVGFGMFFQKMYGVRNIEMTIRFSLKSQPTKQFHRPEISQIKAEISLRTNVKLIFHKNVGLKSYQWIPDFYNIRFEQNNLTEKNYVGSNLML